VADVWLCLIVLSAVPTAAASLLLNPVVFLVLGPDAWRENVARLQPYRWWLGAAIVALCLSTTVYATTYA